MEVLKADKSYTCASTEIIEDLRHRGYGGGHIRIHRALLTSPWNPRKLVASAGLAVALFAGWIAAMGWVSTFWKQVLSFWSEAFGMRSYVSVIHYTIGGLFPLSAPYLHIPSSAPESGGLFASAVATAVVLVATFFLPRRYMPLTYLLRLVVFFHACALVFFTFAPLSFPYGASGYIHALLMAGQILISLIPLVLAFTYYIFDFSVARKLGLTLLIMLYFVIWIPMQFAAHALVMYRASILMMPLLFFVFGLPLDVMIFIAFYSWGASWKNDLYGENGHGRNEIYKKQAGPGRSIDPRDQRHGRSVWMTMPACLFTALSVIAAAGTAVASDDGESGETFPRMTRWEAGADFTHFTNGYGNGNYEFLGATLSREWSYTLRFDLGRAERFGDVGIGAGASLTRYLSGRWSATAGINAGSGDFVLPQYRINMAIARAFLPERNLSAEIGYVREQSKGDNYFDRIAVSTTWYTGPHWMLSGYFHYDLGQPGDTRTRFGGIGVTWYTWRRTYLGGLFQYGDISYTQVGPESFLVSYAEALFRVYYTAYFSREYGLNLRLDAGRNDFYDILGVSAGLFREW